MKRAALYQHSEITVLTVPACSVRVGEARQDNHELLQPTAMYLEHGILSSDCPHNIENHIFEIDIFKPNVSEIEIVNKPFELPVLPDRGHEQGVW